MSINQYDATSGKLTKVAGMYENGDDMKYPDYANEINILGSGTTYPYTYTATEDGWIKIGRLFGNGTSGTFITINGKSVAGGSGTLEIVGLLYPVKKNDVIVFSNLNNSYTRGTFLPNR